MPINVNLLKEIAEIAGAPGFEQRIREIVIREVTPLVDKVEVDMPSKKALPIKK